MRLIGLNIVEALIAEPHYDFKLIANDTGVIFFPRSTEHRNAGQAGIRYADNYTGNALAAIVKPGRIEFRFHKEFTDDMVRDIAITILSDPLMAFAATFDVTYQNRFLIAGGVPCDTRT